MGSNKYSNMGVANRAVNSKSLAEFIDPGFNASGAPFASPSQSDIHRYATASDHRGRAVHAGKRTHDAMWKAMNTGAAKAMGTGAAIGGAFGAMTTMDPMMHGTWHEFTDPSRIATGIPGAITGTVLGAAAGYGLYKADKALGAKLDARDAARED